MLKKYLGADDQYAKKDGTRVQNKESKMRIYIEYHLQRENKENPCDCQRTGGMSTIQPWRMRWRQRKHGQRSRRTQAVYCTEIKRNRWNFKANRVKCYGETQDDIALKVWVAN